MQDIKVKNSAENDIGWKFAVSVSGSGFEVEVDKEYWRKLTEEKEKPENLVKRSFEFLLAREPKESILKSFNLKQIQNYFSEYEEEIKVSE